MAEEKWVNRCGRTKCNVYSICPYWDQSDCPGFKKIEIVKKAPAKPAPARASPQRRASVPVTASPPPGPPAPKRWSGWAVLTIALGAFSVGLSIASLAWALMVIGG